MIKISQFFYSAQNGRAQLITGINYEQRRSCHDEFSTASNACDDQIDKETNISCYCWSVSGHINHIVDVIGHDYVGIGADYDGVSAWVVAFFCNSQARSPFSHVFCTIVPFIPTNDRKNASDEVGQQTNLLLHMSLSIARRSDYTCLNTLEPLQLNSLGISFLNFFFVSILLPRLLANNSCTSLTFITHLECPKAWKTCPNTSIYSTFSRRRILRGGPTLTWRNLPAWTWLECSRELRRWESV